MQKIFFIILISITLIMLSISLFANTSNVVGNEINQIIGMKSNSTEKAIDNHSERYSEFNAYNQIYAFVVFYRSTCPHCQRFIPILSQFSKDFGFKIYAYSTDGQALPALDNTMPITPSVEKTFFDSPSIEVPTVFFINVKTMQAYLIDRGEMDYLGLFNRVKIFFSLLNSNSNSNVNSQGDNNVSA